MDQSNREIKVFASLEELSLAAAKTFARLAAAAINADGSFFAALSGGSTPRRTYELLAGSEFQTQLDWSRIHLFQVDERPVPPDHAESNYRMIRAALLEPAHLPPQNFHRMAAERTDLDNVATEYEADLRQTTKTPHSEMPRLHLIMLGMGPDGHTASLFPGSEALVEVARAVRPNYVAKFKSNRLTLTYPVLNNAGQVLFLVAGADKGESLRHVLFPAPQSPRLPAQAVQPVHGQLTWYLDQPAASLIKNELNH